MNTPTKSPPGIRVRQGQEPSRRTGVHARPARQGRAFTLLELLVVTVIVAILAALILGGVLRAKRAAQRVACLNNLRQWGCAAFLYAHDHNDRLPREAAADGINTWEMAACPTNQDVWYNALAQTAGIAPMAGYAQTPSSQQDFYASAKTFHCPRARFSDIAATYPNFSLAINSKLMRDFEHNGGPWPPAGLGPVTPCKLSSVSVPAKTALFLDNGLPGDERLSPFQALYTGEPKAFASQFPGRHNGGGNIGFCDGHVRTLPGVQVVETDPASLFRGGAIYPPREVIWCPNPESVP